MLAGIHAENKDSIDKWEKLYKNIHDYHLRYKIPMVVYIDVNSDLTKNRYKEWKKKIPIDTLHKYDTTYYDL